MRGLLPGVVAAFLVGARPPAPAAGQTVLDSLVSYDVELSTRGSLLDSNCPATGTDVLAGTLRGVERRNGDDIEYVGTLTRTTAISLCATKRLPNGEDANCNLSIAGNGFADVILTVYPGRQGAWLQYITDRNLWAGLLQTPSGPQNSTVTGNCDPADMSQLQTDYPKGETAGSPNGQPLEVPLLAPASFPRIFPAKPPISIWTLKVIARRP